MRRPTSEMEKRTTELLERILSGLKLALVLTIYFSLCVIIILLFVGAIL